jgi:hypothetical protein
MVARSAAVLRTAFQHDYWFHRLGAVRFGGYPERLFACFVGFGVDSWFLLETRLWPFFISIQIC